MESIVEVINQYLGYSDEALDVLFRVLEIIGGSAVLGKLLPDNIKQLDASKSHLVVANLKNLVNIVVITYNLVIQIVNAVGLNKPKEAKPDDNK